MFTLLVLGTIFLAGGGAFAAVDGLLGKQAQAEADKVKLRVSAAIARVEADSAAVEKDVIARIKAELAKL